MSKQEFLNNFRIARNLFVHPRIETDGNHLDPQSVSQQLARAAIWLTPRSVAGFNAADFPELGPDKQRDLQTAIRDFMEVAKQVPANKPATTEQNRNGAAAFEKLLAILQIYLAIPDEGTVVAKALRRVEFPPWVLNWDYELGSDWAGDPLITVNIYADESAATPKEMGRAASQMTQTVRQALYAAGVKRFPFLQFSTAFEYKSR